jgi:hypothetical protein
MATVASGLNSGAGYNDSDTITSTTLNNHVNNATVTGIVNADVASNAAIAFTKLAPITSQKVLGSIGSGNAEIDIVGTNGILKNDDALGTSDTQGATQGNIKAYVDAEVDTYALKYSGSTGTFNSSSSYADLNLSSVVGSNRAMVILEISGPTVSSDDLFFRTKGSSIEPYTSTNKAGWGSSGVTIGNGIGGTIVLTTDSSGIIQHRTQGNSLTGISYTLQAYQVLK